LRLALAMWLLFLSCLATGEAQGQQYPVLSGATITANGSKPITGLSSGELDLVVAVNGSVDGGGAALSVTVAEIDPLNLGVMLDGGVSISVGPITASVALAPTHAKLFGSSAVVVQWTVDGGSYFSGVDISLVGRTAVGSPSVEGIDGGSPVGVNVLNTVTISQPAIVVLDSGIPANPYSYDNGFQINCSNTSATPFPAQPAGSVGFWCQNLGPNEVCINYNDAGAIATPGSYCLGPGVPGVSPGDDLPFPFGPYQLSWFCIAANAPQVNGGNLNCHWDGP